MSPFLLGVDLDNHSKAVFKLMPTHLGETRRKLRDGELYSMLVDFHRSEASEPRDKIFALLGLCSDPNVWQKIVPDYGLTESAVARATIAYLLTKGHGPTPGWVSSVDIPSICDFLGHLAHAQSSELYMEHFRAHVLRFWDVETVRTFLNRMGADFRASRSMVDAAASNRSDAQEVLGILLQSGSVCLDSFGSVHDSIPRNRVSRSRDTYSGIVHSHLLRKLNLFLQTTPQSHGEKAVSLLHKRLYGLLSHVSEGYLENLILQLGDSSIESKLLFADPIPNEETRALETTVRHLIPSGSEDIGGFEWKAFFTIMILRAGTQMIDSLFEHELTDFSIRDDQFALYCAIFHRHQLATLCLLQKGAPIVIGQLLNPLSCALYRQDTETIDLLRLYSANIVGCDGRMPLHCAVELETIPVIRFLLEQGADSDVVDPTDSRTAIQVARDSQRSGVIHLLEAVKCGRLDKLKVEAAEVAEMRRIIDGVIGDNQVSWGAVSVSQTTETTDPTATSTRSITISRSAIAAARRCLQYLHLQFLIIPALIIYMVCFFFLKWCYDKTKRKRAFQA
ncbi:hypothetical protein F4808DRAFT_407851 [Astrocystis sublimbata]|nr:hypothetical protein F4808DRAFT_407851 [Astrocystis sublimbata]